MKTLAQKLRLRPTEMARALGVSYDVYKSWCSGARQPSAAVWRLAEIFERYPEIAHQYAKASRS